MKIAVIGSGYVGLVTGACLAVKGHTVFCVDKKRHIIDAINQAKTPIYEPGLDTILKQAVSAGHLVATDDLQSSVFNTDISIITVGTPFNEGKINLCDVQNAAWEIGRVLKERKRYHIVCVKSTVVPTTTDTLVKNTIREASGKEPGEFGLVMNPEFLREGKAVEDFLNPDRIVIGAFDDRSYAGMTKVYEEFTGVPVIRVNLRTAEMIKYTANALLATMISYSNEAASICETIGGIDIREVLEAVTMDKRINPRIEGELVNPGIIQYLRAGCGFGGSCFPKDVKSLISFSSARGYLPQIISSTVKVNQEQPLRLLHRLEEKLGTFKKKKIAVLGLAFKPDTDDVRESPSITVISHLIQKGAHTIGVDPIAAENMSTVIPEKSPDILYSFDYKTALEGADAAIIITAWSEFLNISPAEFRQRMKNPIIADGRRAFNKETMKNAGCIYMGIGLEVERSHYGDKN